MVQGVGMSGDGSCLGMIEDGSGLWMSVDEF